MQHTIVGNSVDNNDAWMIIECALINEHLMRPLLERADLVR